MLLNSRIILSAFLFLVTIETYSQDSFIKIFDAINGYGWESPYCTKQIAPNKIVMAGTLRSSDWSSEEGFLMVLDSSFNLVWSKKYYTGTNTRIFSFEHTSDNGFLLIGSIIANILNPYGVYVVKTDSTGHVLWSKIYEGFDAVASCLASNGDCLITGQSIRVSPNGGISVINLIRINGNGDMLLNYTFGVNPPTTYVASGTCIKETLDGGIIITGNTEGANINTFASFLIKTDAAGVIEWSKTYDGIPIIGVTNPDVGENILLEPDSGFLITGTGTSPMSNNLKVMYKTDKNGNILWGTSTNPCSVYIHGQKVCKLNNGYAVLAWDHINNRAHLAATDSVGTVLWQKQFGSVSVSDWFAASIWQSGPSEITFATNRTVSDHNIYIAKTSTQADSCSIWYTNICNSVYQPNEANTFFLREELDEETPIQTTASILVFTEDYLCDGITMTIHEQEKSFGVNIFPIPATNTLNVHMEMLSAQITVNDINGKILWSQFITENNFTIPLNSFVSGVYFLKIQSKDTGPVMKKFLVVD